MNDRVNNEERQSGIRRTTIFLSVVALAFFIGFILMGVLNA
jgi:hypothetical protein